MPEADTKTLEMLAERIKKDTADGGGISYSGARSIAAIIEESIGAPLCWPTRDAGLAAAQAYYMGNNDLRHAFNAGVKWAVEYYSPTLEINYRFIDK